MDWPFMLLKALSGTHLCFLHMVRGVYPCSYMTESTRWLADDGKLFFLQYAKDPVLAVGLLHA
jgi:hypothetical protein